MLAIHPSKPAEAIKNFGVAMLILFWIVDAVAVIVPLGVLKEHIDHFKME